MILRTIKCDVCGAAYTEASENAGFPGWAHIGGVTLNGVANPNLCPDHKVKVMNFIDQMVEGCKNGVD